MVLSALSGMRDIPRVRAALSRAAVLFGVASIKAWAATDSVVTINELMYHPADPVLPATAAGPEWIELHNPMSIRVDVGGWSLRGGVNFTVPEGTVMEPGAYLVISAVAGTPAGALGPFSGRLDNAGEEVRLHERWGRMMDRVEYRDGGDWPPAADGGGPSLAKRWAELPSEPAASWVASAADGGTPGAVNFPVPVEVPPRAVFVTGGPWKYDPGDSPPPAEWTALDGFSDAEWVAGDAPLGTAGAVTPPVPVTGLPAGREVYYLRRSFAWSGPYPNAQILLTGMLKGRAVVFLNGERLGEGTGRGAFGISGSGAGLRAGANVLAVELWPLASDGGPEAVIDLALTVVDGETAVASPLSPLPPAPVVINEISYHARPTYADPAGSIPFAENPDEWIELHNPGTVAVDLAGWRLSDAVSFVFPAGTTLGPGGYLVVRRDQFSGSLANRGDRVRLRDATGGLVDEVPYFDGGRWPEAADGGGSTLERRDPRGDGRRAETWAASDESARGEWQTVTYRATGGEPPGSNNPSNWKEFLLGFLDAGEALVDDISVLEDPDGTRVQLIQNGTFENDVAGGGAAHWRLLGTHKRSRVVVDPGGTGQVLHLVATGPLEHTYNNASTTVAGNRPFSASRTYEISYRAKWLSGSPQLNSRLYLNRAARTTILRQPSVSGTPGAANSRRVAHAGPTFDGLRHSPLVPAASQPVRVSVSAADPDGLSSATLFFSVSQGAWQSVPMGPDADGRLFGVLPGQSTGVSVQFYVRAVDGAGVAADFPPRGPASRALYRVGDAGVSSQPVRNKMRMFMTAADANELHNPVHSVSDFRWPCTVVYNDQEVWYDAAVRLRSAPYGRQGNRAGWNIQFGHDRPFRGGLTTVVIDGAFNMPRTDGGGWLENSLGPSVNEMLFHAIANRAGGIPANYDDAVYFQTPRAAEGNRRAQLKLQRFGNGYLEEAFPDGADGLLFKQELIYHPTSTVDGRPDSLKNPYNAHLDTEIRNFGPSKDNYRFNYIPQNNEERDDFERIMALGQAFGSSSATLYANTSAVMDADNWMRVFALNVLVGLADTYNNGLAHNIQLYVRPGDRKVMLFPWDQDHAFYYGPTASIYGGGTHRLAAVLNLPANRRLYAGHLRHLCRIAFNNTFLDPVIDHLNSSAVANRPQYAPTFRSYVTSRRNYVLSQINSQFPAVAFAVTTNGGADVTTAEPSAVVEGTGWIDVRSILVSRNGSPPEAAPVTWLDGRRWRLTLPVVVGANAFAFTAVDHDGSPVGTGSLTVTNTGTVDPATAGNLALSEIHYHPAGIAAEEFLEIMNIGERPIDLTGVAFTNGISFTFTGSAITTLAPGARALVVEDRAAFEARYGTGRPIAGTFAAGARLANNGDRITLVDRAGAVIADLKYEDSLPWPPEADGLGWSLTLIRPESRPDPAVAAHWRPSRQPGGSPGESDALSVIGFASLLDYALTAPPATFADAAGTVFLAWGERVGADQARVMVELSDDLISWVPDPGDGTSLVPDRASTNAEGHRTLTCRFAGERPRHRFIRLRVVPR